MEDRIATLLKETNLGFEEIANRCGCTISEVSNINIESYINGK